MSEQEIKELREKLLFGLALAEKRMLKEKALHNSKIIVSKDGKIREISAKYLYRKRYGKISD